jgi:hypothetical protein
VPLAGTPHGRALAAQSVEVIAEDGGARVFAPVTSRGEAVGVLELGLELQPAGEIGGDTFDFSPERDTLHLSHTDAIGHTMDARGVRKLGRVAEPAFARDGSVGEPVVGGRLCLCRRSTSSPVGC